MSSIQYINSIVITSSTSSAVFNNIPQNYEDLILSCSTRFGSASGSKIRFNSDSASNYSLRYINGQASSAGSGGLSNITSIHNNLVWGDATVVNSFTPYIINIMSYKNSNIQKTISWEYGTGGGLQGSSSEVGTVFGLWRNTSPITSIEISTFNATTYQIGSNFVLWGIK